MSDTSKTGNLSTTLATYVWLLAEAGHAPAAGPVRDALDALRDAEPEAADAAGIALAAVLDGALGGSEEAEAIGAMLAGLYGDDAFASHAEESREARLRAIRAAEFKSSLPWRARVVDRFPNGSVSMHWVLVERVTDEVLCMDPYPWDDLDEEYVQPTLDFLVKWELAGGGSFRWVG
jgi:hypothetical protein